MENVKLTISRKRFMSGAGAPLYMNEKAVGLTPASRENAQISGRMIHTPYSGDIEFVFPTKKAARAYAGNPHAKSVTRNVPDGTHTTKLVTYPAGLRHDAEIGRFGGQSPYWEDKVTLPCTTPNMNSLTETVQLYAGMVAKEIER